MEPDRESIQRSPFRVFLKFNIWAGLWAVIILLLTALPGNVLPQVPAFLDLFKPDKLIHLFIFAVYVLLQIPGFTKQPVVPYLRNNPVLTAIVAGFFLSAITEILQACLIPMRNGSVYDFLANAAGCLVGWVIAWKLRIIDRAGS